VLSREGMRISLTALAVAGATAFSFPAHGSPTLRCPAHYATRERAISMVRDDEKMFIDPADSENFGDDELAATWERTGKGKARWKPGDRTGDSLLDTRLLYSNWVLNPLKLHVQNGLHAESLQAALILGWLNLPFAILSYSGDGATTGFARKDDRTVTISTLDLNEGALPRLQGPGVPSSPGCEDDSGLQSVAEIGSFGTAVAKQRTVAPASGRVDVAAWLADESATVESFAPLLNGLIPGAIEAPCLNSWGLTMDDAVAVAALVARCEAKQREPDDEMVKCYMDGCFEAAGLVGLFGSLDE